MPKTRATGSPEQLHLADRKWGQPSRGSGRNLLVTASVISLLGCKQLLKWQNHREKKCILAIRCCVSGFTGWLLKSERPGFWNSTI